jgi:hypothetical protein
VEAWFDLRLVRAGAYVLVAAAAVGMWISERRRAGGSAVLWPWFWLGTALILMMLAVGRLVDVGQVVTEFGRERARSSGWYGSRRRAQAFVAGTIALAWFVTLVVAIWRVPERRRYLPMALVSATLVSFAAIRLISLHSVDTVLYRPTIAGVRPVLLAEYGLLLLAAAAMAWRWVGDRRCGLGPSPRRGRRASVVARQRGEGRSRDGTSSGGRPARYEP